MPQSLTIGQVAQTPHPGFPVWLPWSITAASITLAAGALWALRRRPGPAPIVRTPVLRPPVLEDISLQTLLLESSAGRVEQTLAQIIDDTGTIIAASPAFQSFVEDNRLDPRLARSGENLLSLVSDPAGLMGDSAPLAGRALGAVLSGKGPPVRLEYRVSTPHTSASVVMSVLRITEGGVGRTVVMHIPGADRVRMSALLQESERRYRLLFKLSPLPMMVISLGDGNILAANEAAGRLLDVPLQDLEGRTLVSMMEGQRAAPLRDQLANRTNAATPATLRRGDGAFVRTEIHFASLAFEGAPAQLLVLRDLTEQIAAQSSARLRESMLAAVARAGEWLVEETDWRAGLRNTLPGLLDAAQADRVLVVQVAPDRSDPLVMVSQWPETEEPLSHPCWNEVLTPHVLASLGAGRGIENEVVACAAGKPPMLIAAAPVLVGGDLWGFITLKRVDITRRFGAAENDSLRSFAGIIGASIQRAQINAALRKSDEKLLNTQKIEAIGQLASGISHDFNNLLTAIHGYLALAKGSLAPDHPAAPALEQVELAARQAGGVANSLLTFTRRTQGERRLTQLSTLIEPAMRLVRRSLPANVSIKVEGLDGSSPWVNCDPSQIQQALVALSLNARDAMPNGGTLRVASSVAHSGDGDRTVSIVVEDTGIGMTPEVLHRAFEPFFTTKPRPEASGLGLAITHSIVHQHGGTIEVASEPGRGTRFTISLPATDAPSEPVLFESKSAPVFVGTALIVEDHELVAALVSSTLASMGYSPIHVTTVGEAESGMADPPAVLVVDVELPDANGVQWVRSLRQRGIMTPALFISGRAEIGNDSESVAHAAVLFKPFQTGDLMRNLRELVRPSGEGVIS